jgi:hypothetical protein
MQRVNGFKLKAREAAARHAPISLKVIFKLTLITGILASRRQLVVSLMFLRKLTMVQVIAQLYVTTRAR